MHPPVVFVFLKYALLFFAYNKNRKALSELEIAVLWTTKLLSLTAMSATAGWQTGLLELLL